MEAFLSTETTTSDTAPRPAIRRRTWAFGPGLVFVLAAVGPQDLITNSAAGLGYGYALLWTLAVIVMARYVILEASARYVVVTGETLMAGYARGGRCIVWVIFVSIFIKRHMASLYHVLLLGAAMELIVPVRTSWTTVAWGLSFWVLGFALMYWGRYGMVEKFSKPMLVILGGSLATAAIFSKPDLLAVARGAVIPTIPEGYGIYSYALILMALAGAGAGSLSSLKYAAFVHEKGWRDVSFMKRQRTDLMLTATGLFVMFALIQIAAAATLRPSGATLEQVGDLLPIFSSILGPAGSFVLGICLWASIFTTYVGSTTGYSLLVSDIYHNVLRPSGPSVEDTEQKSSGTQKAFRWCVIWFFVSPLYIVFTDWEPIWLVLISSALLLVLLPLITLVLMWLTNRKDLMGEHVNGWASNAAMTAIVVISLYLTYRNAIDLLMKLIG